MKKPFVYIMGPYTKGDTCINTRFQCQIFNQMMDDGLVLPYSPLLLHFQHTMFPRHYQDWIDYDLAILPRFDAGIRLDAAYDSPKLEYRQSESSGADGEEDECRRLEIPVFHSISELYSWVRGAWHG